MGLGATYEVWACDPFGARLTDLSNFTQLKYTRIGNDWSTATITLPPGFDPRVLRIPDAQIHIFRNGKLVTDTIWLLQEINPVRDSSGNVTVTINADTPLVVLRDPGRCIWTTLDLNAVVETQGTYSGAADDVIKQIIREQVAAASPGVNMVNQVTILGSPVNLYPLVTVDPDESRAPAVSKMLMNKPILSSLQEIAQDSAQQGTYLAFDIVADAPTALAFRTFVGQRGVDHRAPSGQNPVILSPDFGTLAETNLLISYRDEITHVIVWGKGDWPYPVVYTSQDTTRLNASPWRFRSRYMDYKQSADLNVLAGVARGVIRGGRPLAILTGKVVSTPACQYGVHWQWGDYVTMQDFGYSFDVRIDAISVTVDDTAQGPFETVDATLRAETYL